MGDITTEDEPREIPQVVRTKYGPTKPSADDLEDWQLGYAYNEKKLYIKDPMKDAEDQIVDLSGKAKTLSTSAIPQCICDSENTSVIKEVDISSFEDSQLYLITFTNGNIANEPYFKIGDKSYPIKVGNLKVGRDFIGANETHLFKVVYNDAGDIDYLEDLTTTVVEHDSSNRWVRLRGGHYVATTSRY